jgi:hypothetical protein
MSRKRPASTKCFLPERKRKSEKNILEVDWQNKSVVNVRDVPTLPDCEYLKALPDHVVTLFAIFLPKDVCSILSEYLWNHPPSPKRLMWLHGNVFSSRHVFGIPQSFLIHWCKWYSGSKNITLNQYIEWCTEHFSASSRSVVHTDLWWKQVRFLGGNLYLNSNPNPVERMPEGFRFEGKSFISFWALIDAVF